MSKLTLEKDGIEVIYEGKPVNKVKIYQMICKTCDCMFEFTEGYARNKCMGDFYKIPCPCCGEEDILLPSSLEDYLERTIVLKKEKVKIWLNY